MKNTKLILMTAVAMAALFSAVIFTACTKKVTCDSVACHNGGVCTGGSCVCPTGYSGSFCEVAATTYISYQNNTFTPITIIINGVTKTLPVGEAMVVSGLYGATATGSATTSGAASQYGVNNPGGTLGVLINWELNNNFPSTASDTLRQPLDVGPTYFFLRMANKSSQNVIDFYVNVNFPYGQLYQDVTVPDDSKTYDLGYYLAYPNSNVQTQSSGSKVEYVAVTLPFTNNQTFTATIN